jgi:hypothetical protein
MLSVCIRVCQVAHAFWQIVHRAFKVPVRNARPLLLTPNEPYRKLASSINNLGCEQVIYQVEIGNPSHPYRAVVNDLDRRRAADYREPLAPRFCDPATMLLIVDSVTIEHVGHSNPGNLSALTYCDANAATCCSSSAASKRRLAITYAIGSRVTSPMRFPQASQVSSASVCKLSKSDFLRKGKGLPFRVTPFNGILFSTNTALANRRLSRPDHHTNYGVDLR